MPRCPRSSSGPHDPKSPGCSFPVPHPALAAELRLVAAMFNSLPPGPRQALAHEARLALQVLGEHRQEMGGMARVLGGVPGPGPGPEPAVTAGEGPQQRPSLSALLLGHAIEAAWDRERAAAFSEFTREGEAR